ncbi:MAG: hypothetical protein KGL54_15410 [Sphingomonadales bacterium]|nr:hypothetical protein [Sphingomonadales bacterium]
MATTWTPEDEAAWRRMLACDHEPVIFYRYTNGLLAVGCEPCNVNMVWSDGEYRRKTGKEPPPRKSTAPTAPTARRGDANEEG